MKVKPNELGLSGLIKSSSFPAEKFSHLHQEKDAITSLFDFQLSIENWMYYLRKT